VLLFSEDVVAPGEFAVQMESEIFEIFIQKSAALSIQQTKVSVCTASRLAAFQQWGWSRRKCKTVDTA
jgi:hypothetical protein